MSSTAEAAAEAHRRFVGGQFHSCLDTLHHLATHSARGDPKIQHNIAVCEYFQSGFANVESFLRDLEKLGQPGTNQVSRHVRAQKALDALAESRGQDYRATMCLEFEGHEYVRYNEAVALFHQRQYREAVARLLPLYRNQPALRDEVLTARVLLLMLACVLAQCPAKHSDAADQEHVALRERARELMERIEERRDFLKLYDQQEAEKRKQGECTRAPLKLSQHALLLSAHYRAVAEGEHSGAMQLLHDFMQRSKESYPQDWWDQVLYLNNLGVLHLNVGKPQLAGLYLGMSVQAFEQKRKQRVSSSDQQATSLTAYPSMAAVMYNNAVCCMVRGQYELAFRCLIQACPLLHDMPTLWLRLAQCCIRQYELRLEQHQTEKHRGLQKQGPPGSKRVVHLPTMETLRLPSDNSGDKPAGSSAAGAAASPDMSLEFADKCLRNAHYLLLRRHRAQRRPPARCAAPPSAAAPTPRTPDAAMPPDQEEGATELAELRGQEDAEDCADGDDTDGHPGQLEEDQVHEAVCLDKSAAVLLQSVYCNMAYVALCLNNPAVALFAARKLLSLPEWAIFREYRVVCISYCVEAYCALNRASEALAMLHETNLMQVLQQEPTALKLPARGAPPHRGSCAAELPEVQESPLYMGMPSDKERMLLTRKHAAALFTNLCVVHIMAGKYSRAQQCLDQSKADGQPIAHLLQIYLHLAQGKRGEAVLLASRSPPEPPYC
eukprot:TRINITY_DN24312_c2_g1_i1.p1 TRINITY_DN24312_c2_g1~~TRINITY_DN24312_c2_g1_i1.p1  ORF type:complete len:721 (+),score=287.70 TRINITY_DN24312_c2_g1_i1:194-2356(+)